MTFVVNGQGQVRGIDWCFNAWGGICDGLYADWEKDDKVASSFCRKTGYDLYDAHPFVLEGGAIHTDGEGTILVTESCLLSKGRNPELSKRKDRTEVKGLSWGRKIIWIPYGIYNDETNGHIDNVCAFTSPRTCGACVDGGSQRSAVSLVICRSCNIGKRDRCQGAEAHSPQSPGSGEAGLYNGI